MVKIVVLALLTRSGSLWSLTFEQFQWGTRDIRYAGEEISPDTPLYNSPRSLTFQVGQNRIGSFFTMKKTAIAQTSTNSLVSTVDSP